MTPNDAQIDLLLKSYSRKANSSVTDHVGSGERGGTHLDADELNAFAEGALPPTARARYVSHLTDCERCRKLATQLAVAAGTTVPMRAEAANEISERASLWQRFKDAFAVPNLRYAAFALVVIAAVGITFVALRRERQSNLVAENTRVAPAQGSAVEQSQEVPGQANQSSENQATSPAASSNSDMAKKQLAPEPPATLAPAKEGDLAKSAAVSEKKKAESEVAEVAPSYAPPPPGERAEPTSSEEKNLKTGIATSQPAPKPKQSDDEFKVSDRARADEAARGREMEIQRSRAGQGGSTNRNEVGAAKSPGVAEKSSVARRTVDKSAGESQDQSRTQGLVADSNSAAPEERKAGGRSFRRQGGAWIDKKFKSSMSVTDIRRGSEEFRALDSGLRSIADQLSGEVVVVWKGKAYRIR
jgi:hypothetical protein